MSCKNCRDKGGDFVVANCEPACVNSSFPGIPRCATCHRRDCAHHMSDHERITRQLQLQAARAKIATTSAPTTPTTSARELALLEALAPYVCADHKLTSAGQLVASVSIEARDKARDIAFTPREPAASQVSATINEDGDLETSTGLLIDGVEAELLSPLLEGLRNRQPHELVYGYDGYVKTKRRGVVSTCAQPMTRAERREIAAFVIAQWKEWAETDPLVADQSLDPVLGY